MEFDWMLAVKATIAAVFGAFSAFWGWMGWLAVTWIVLMALDYLTGTAAAVKSGTWASKSARDGIWHKTGEIVVVVVSALADRVLAVVAEQLPLVDIALPGVGLLLPMVLVWYCVTELGSVLENAAAMGAPIPEWLSKILANAEKKLDDAGNTVAPK